MELTAVEKASPVWRKIEEHFEERLAILYSQLCKSLPSDPTNVIRGQILEIKVLRSLGEEKPFVAE